MSNPQLQNYTAYRERRDQLVGRFCDLSDHLEDYNIKKLPIDALDEIFAIIIRQADGSLHRYLQDIEGIRKVNVTLSQDIERLEHIYQRYPIHVRRKKWVK